jgi:hypothetical protein
MLLPQKRAQHGLPREGPTVLDWLRRIFAHDLPERPAPMPDPHGLHVAYDSDLIILKVPDALDAEIAWKELISVAIVSGDASADPPELYWLLHGNNRRRPLLIPMGIPGEHDLVHVMQSRLEGFDNMAVVEAMSAKGRVLFKIWDASAPDT